MAFVRSRGREDVMTSSVTQNRERSRHLNRTNPNAALTLQPGAATRFRSPTPKVGGRGEPNMTSQVVKRSRRTKSQESHEREPQRLLKTEYKDKESVAASIWQSFGKDVEKMRHEELVSKFKLLLNEHMKLEKFLSFCLREHEISKNQMECELLDAMIYIEDLKKALETKLARKNRVMPVEAEERRALIRQNKKLLKQLYETAKKVENLEAMNVEQKEQLEVMEFQVMEAENQRIVMDEIIRQHGLTEKPVGKANAAAQVKMMSNDELCLKREMGQLREQNSELRRQLQLADDENSLAESDMGAVHVVENMKIQLAQKDTLIRELEERIKTHQKQCNQRPSPVTSNANRSPAKLADNEPTSSEDPEGVEETLGAMSSLIQSSFLPLSCAVPFEHVTESLPDILKERKDDTLLMNTIRTFQSLVNERENEIGELKGRLKQYGEYSSKNRPEIRFMDCVSQTELDLVQCRLLESHMKLMGVDDNDWAPNQVAENDTMAHESTSYHHLNNILFGIEKCLHDNGLIDDEALSKAATTSFKDRAAIIYEALGKKHPAGELEKVNRELRERLEKMEKEKDGIISQVREANLVLQKNLEVMETAKKQQNQQESQRSPHKVTNKSTASPGEVVERIQQLEKDNRRWRSYVENLGRSEDDLLQKVATMEETLLDAQARETAIRAQLEANAEELKSAFIDSNKKTSVTQDTSASKTSSTGDRSVRYYSMQLQDIHYQSVIDQMRRKLELDSKKRREVEKRAEELEEEIKATKQEKEAVEARLQTAKRMETALKRRLEILESNPQGSSRTGAQTESKVIELESENATLHESARLDQTRLHQMNVRLTEMEAVNRAYMDRIHELEMRDLATNKKMLRLQATYEDMMREYSDVRARDSTWRKRAKTYETLEASLAQTKASYEQVLKRMEEEVGRLNTSIQRLSNENEQLRERIKEMATKMKETHSSALAMADELEARKRGNQDSLDRLSSAVAKNRNLEARLREMDDERARVERCLRLVEDQKSALLVEVSNLQLTNQEMSRQLSSTRIGCDALKEELELVSCRQTQSQRHRDEMLMERLDWERRIGEFEREERSLKKRCQQHEDAEAKLKQKILQLESKLSQKNNSAALTVLQTSSNRTPNHEAPDVEEVIENTGHLQDQIHFLKSTCDSQSAEISRLRSHILTLEGDLAESQATYMPPPGFVLITQGEYDKVKRKSSLHSLHPNSEC